MANSSKQMTLQQLCDAKNVSHQDVEDLLELYSSDAPEDEVLERIARYPEAARAIVSTLILPSLGGLTE